MQHSEKYYNIVREELKKFISKYQKNPFDFLTEYDIQSYLYTKIFDSFDDEGIKVEIETEGKNEDVLRWKQNANPKININPVKTEYPADYLFDIAVIDNNALEVRTSAYWHQKLKIAIEIKFHRCSFYRIPAEIKKFKSDIDKLKKYQSETHNNFRGISILFIQNDNEERENEFEINRFKKNYEKINIDTTIAHDGVDGIVITAHNCFRLIDPPE